MCSDCKKKLTDLTLPKINSRETFTGQNKENLIALMSALIIPECCRVRSGSFPFSDMNKQSKLAEYNYPKAIHNIISRNCEGKKIYYKSNNHMAVITGLFQYFKHISMVFAFHQVGVGVLS